MYAPFQGVILRGLSILLAFAVPLVVGTAAAQNEEDAPIEEIVTTGTQIKGAKISDALAVSVLDAGEIEALGISSGDELFDTMPEMGQNFFNEADNIDGGVNSVRGDIGAFNLRNMGTGNTLALLNGRRLVQAAGYQTESIGGSFVPVNSVNTNSLPVFGVQRVEVLRDGASAIYGADAVAGVVNTVLQTDFEGFSVQARYDSYDHVPRNDRRLNIQWGKFFNDGATNVSVFFDYYDRDRVNSQDEEKWGRADWALDKLVGTPWEGESDFVNDSANSLFGQFDFRLSVTGDDHRALTDGAGEFETYPLSSPECQAADAWIINDVMCGAPDPGTRPDARYNLNENRDLVSAMERYNLFVFINHEFANGMESFTELGYYEAENNLFRHASFASQGAADLQVGPENYYNPFGPCGSPNRLPDSVIGTDVSCAGERLEIDNYRFAELPRIVDTDNNTIRLVQGFRGTLGAWDWETALVWSEAERNDVTHNRVSNSLMQEALDDPTPAAYNPFSGGINSNIERALIDVYRKNETDLKMIDLKVTNPELFEIWAGPVGFLAGAEYREESFVDDRDPRLDGTIVFTAFEGATYPIIGDVANSSPTADSKGGRDVTSLFTEFAIPLHETLDVQLAVRYEDLSDVGDTTVGKAAFGWRPIDQLLFRGSWSEAFRAPNLITINEELVVRQNIRDDAVCEYVEDVQGVNLDCDSSVQRRARGSEDLVSEQSTNTSFGVVWDAMDGLTLTLDFWEIEKEDSIGLFGEYNHTILDLLYRLQAGTANCDGAVFNPVVGREEPDEDEAQLYLDSGVCPAGAVEFVEDNYANLDTRTIAGHDVGVYYDRDTSFGTFNFRYVGTFYDKYTQEAGGLAQVVLEAVESGALPSNTAIVGFDKLLRRDGNADNKHTASLRWRKDAFGAGVTMNRLGKFYASEWTTTDGTRYWLDSMTTYNAYFDYDFDAFNADNRVRLGINNVGDERAPVAEENFNYWSDAHRDLGRYYYLDLRMDFQ